MDSFDLLPSLADGELAESSATELVAAIYRSRASGTLTIEAPESGEVRQFFRAGQMCGSSYFSGFRTLAQVLLEHEWAQALDVDESLHEAQAQGRRHGELLLEKGLLTPEQLAQALAAQHRHNLMALMALERGHYEMRGWEPPPLWTRALNIDPLGPLLDSLEEPRLAHRRALVLDWLGPQAARLTSDWTEMAERALLEPSDHRAIAQLAIARTRGEFLAVSRLMPARAEALLCGLILIGAAEPTQPSAQPQPPIPQPASSGAAAQATVPPRPRGAPAPAANSAAPPPRTNASMPPPSPQRPRAPTPPPGAPPRTPSFPPGVLRAPPSRPPVAPPQAPPLAPAPRRGPPSPPAVRALPPEPLPRAPARPPLDLEPPEDDVEIERVETIPRAKAAIAPGARSSYTPPAGFEDPSQYVALAEEPLVEALELDESRLPEAQLASSPGVERAPVPALEPAEESLELDATPRAFKPGQRAIPPPLSRPDELVLSLGSAPGGGAVSSEAELSIPLEDEGARARPREEELELLSGAPAGGDAVRKKLRARGLRNIATMAREPAEAGFEVVSTAPVAAPVVDSAALSREAQRFLDEVRARVRALPAQNPWQRLGVSQKATSEQIHAAYLDAVKRYHPDRASALGVSEAADDLRTLFAAIKEAHERVGSAAAREKYAAQSTSSPGGSPRQEEALLALKMGEVLLKKRDFAAAMLKLRRASELDPNGDTLAALAWGLLCDPAATPATRSEAEMLIDRSLRVGGATARTHYVAGVSWRARDAAEAEEAFRRALELDPNHRGAAQELRLLELRQARTKK